MKYNLKTIIRYGFRLIWWMLNAWRFKKLGIKTIILKPLKITPTCIVCEKNVYIFKNCRIEGVLSYNNKIFTPTIHIKSNVSIQQNCHITCAQLIEIGENTAIAANVTITDINHPYQAIKIPIERQDIDVKGVSIGKNC